MHIGKDICVYTTHIWMPTEARRARRTAGFLSHRAWVLEIYFGFFGSSISPLYFPIPNKHKHMLYL